MMLCSLTVATTTRLNSVENHTEMWPSKWTPLDIQDQVIVPVSASRSIQNLTQPIHLTSPNLTTVSTVSIPRL